MSAFKNGVEDTPPYVIGQVCCFALVLDLFIWPRSKNTFNFLNLAL